MNWKYPTCSQLGNEFLTEYAIQELYDASGRWSIFTGSGNVFTIKPQMQIFVDTIREVSTHEVFDPDAPVEAYTADTLEELDELVSDMGKDVEMIKSGLMFGGLPYVIMLRDGARLSLLGGRTRVSVCKILKRPYEALVLDREKINAVMLPRVKSAFESYDFGFDVGSVWDWVEGGCMGECPMPEDELDVYTVKEVIVPTVMEYLAKFGPKDEV